MKGRRTDRLVAWLARLVPEDRRADWIREWRAELAWRNDAGRPGAVACIAAAVEDAVGMRLRRRGGGGGPGWTDVRLAARGLRRSPVFTGVVVLTLGLGIGANAAIFSVVEGVLLRPFPWDAPDGLALVRLAFGAGGERRPIAASEPEYLELKAENTAFRDLAGYYVSDVNLGGSNEPLRVSSALVTANFLDVLGVRPVLGRSFVPGEDLPGADDVMLLTHGLWRRAFAADPDIVGTEVRVNDVPVTVVGILPEGFHFPGADVEVLRALTLDPANPGGRSSHWLLMVARLEDGLDADLAQARTDALVDRWVAEHPDRHGPSAGHPVEVRGVREAIVGDVRLPLVLLTGAVALVLLVACLNVANLLLVRGEERQREMDVRVALGAGRGAILRHVTLESLFLAIAGGALGLLLARAGVRWIPLLAAGSLPPGTDVRLDGPVLVFTAAAAALAALLSGVAPAWLAVRRHPARGLALGGRRASAGPRRVAFRRLLVGAEVAAAVTLVASAAVLGRGFARLMDVDPGFDPGGVVTLDFALSSAGYPEPSDVSGFHGELVRRIEALPGVRRAGGVRTLPLRSGGGWETLRLPGRERPADPEGWGWTVQYQVVDPGVFEAMGVPVEEGRSLSWSDDAEAEPVAVLNRTAAKALYGDDPAVGQPIQVGDFPGNANPVMTVVGVVGDVRQVALDEPAPPQIYVPRAQAGSVYGGLGTRFSTLVVRSEWEPGTTLEAVRGVVRDLDPELPVADVGTLAGQVGRSVADRRFVTALMTLFSGVALLLGGLGLYGLMSYVVARRSHEIGVRIALGADRGVVLRRVLLEAGALVVAGGAVGVGGAMLAGELLRTLLFDVSPRDPVALVAAPVVLLLVALGAAWLPARRAAAVDPVRALTAD